MGKGVVNSLISMEKVKVELIHGQRGATGAVIATVGVKVATGLTGVGVLLGKGCTCGEGGVCGT